VVEDRVGMFPGIAKGGGPDSTLSDVGWVGVVSMLRLLLRSLTACCQTRARAIVVRFATWDLVASSVR